MIRLWDYEIIRLENCDYKKKIITIKKKKICLKNK